ncbi:MAG: hypothetical protein MUF04_08835, partial [Akkermansiaceae bacterium]|nr:hypothetical protein [Akkermansiaceae bacterium]
MKRRTFLQTAGTAIVAPALPPLAAAAADPPAVPALAAALRLDLRTLLEADGEATMELAERIFRKCVLEKIRPPVEPLLRTWVVPGGPHYLGQW